MPQRGGSSGPAQGRGACLTENTGIDEKEDLA